MANKSICLCLCAVITITSFATLCSGSAIPMWEYLSRGEKMSHLYSMFAKQVSGHCKNAQEMPTNQCKRNLLMYGINKLQDMSETHLDSMDPYQRGAHDIIWDAMMDGHTRNGQKKTQTTTVPAFVTSEKFSHNPLFDEPAPTQQKKKGANKFGMDYDFNNGPTGQDVQYAEPQNHLPQEAASNLNLQYAASEIHFDSLAPVEQNTNYLSGPMMIRVRPDGTPVEDDKNMTHPKDDDIKEMTIGKDKMPTFQQMYDDLKKEHIIQSQTTSVPQLEQTRNYRITARNSH